MIGEYEEQKPELYEYPRQYGLSQGHKHLPEMSKITGLLNKPVFCPIVSDFYSGMEVTIPLFKSQLNYGGIEEIKEIYKKTYTGPIVSYVALSPCRLACLLKGSQPRPLLQHKKQ